MTTVDVSHPARPLPEVKRLMIAFVASVIPELATVAGQERVTDRAPADLGDRVRNGTVFATVAVLGGESARSEITPTVDFDVWASTHDLAEDVSQRLDQIILGTPILIVHPTRGILHITESQGSVSPSERPWDPDRGIRRYHSSYRLKIRRR